MYGVLLALHILICLALVAVVLVQSGSKGGGLAGGAFGGATQTVFGGRGATDFITRATIILGVTFFVTSLTLALMSSRAATGGGRSLVQEAAKGAQRTPTTIPAPGGATPPAGGQTAPPSGGATPPAGGPTPSPAPPPTGGR